MLVMARKEDLMGKRFGNFVVVAESRSKSGKTRWECKCVLCGKTFQAQSGHIKSQKIRCPYCHPRKEKAKKCVACGAALNGHQYKFCSNRCQSDFQYTEYIRQWKNGEKLSGDHMSRYIRRYMFEKFDNKCAKCGWSHINTFTGAVPLEIDHIDGNYLNNNESNLILLCPNCHSLTKTYKGANKGNGRKYRRSGSTAG